MLVVDIGNSAIRLARLEGVAPGVRTADLTVQPVARLSTPEVIADPSALRAVLGSVSAAVAVSVVPAVSDVLRDCVPDLRVIDEETPFPFTVSMPDTAAVGADRYCNIAAAVFSGWSDALVVDVGTATTFDLLSDGVFEGGLIAPGPGLAARALAQTGARLPDVPLVPAQLGVGLSTTEAMTIGSWQVGWRGISATVDALLEALGRRPVMLTGGVGEEIHAEVTARNPSCGWRLDPHWTLKGAALLASRSR